MGTAAADVRVTGRAALPAPTVRRIVRAVLAGERREAAVSVTFLGPVRMRALNCDYLGHDRPTDVISFGLAQPDGGLALDKGSAVAVEILQRNSFTLDHQTGMAAGKRVRVSDDSHAAPAAASAGQIGPR